MCGRYYRRSDKQRIAEAFHLGKLSDGFVLLPWDYNVAPTNVYVWHRRLGKSTMHSPSWPQAGKTVGTPTGLKKLGAYLKQTEPERQQYLSTPLNSMVYVNRCGSLRA